MRVIEYNIITTCVSVGHWHMSNIGHTFNMECWCYID